jgi:stage II sporulation protein D
VSATGPWRLFDGRNSVLVRGRAGEEWTVERRGRQLRATLRGGSATPWVDGPLTLRPDADESFGNFAGRKYRGVLRVVPTDSSVLVVNVLPIEQYLRGVVPLEIGLRAPAEQAAAEAQAIAARSYTWVHLAQGGTARNAAYDMLAGVSDQVYGGVDAERPFSDAAVQSTAGLVIKYNGRIADAPYHSSCGGETASPEEVWRATPEPYLKRVSDKIPGSKDRFYCDIAPRFAWTRAFTNDELDAAVRSYLRNFVSVPSSGPGHVQAVAIETRTPSGRVGQLVITTDRGKYNLRGNEIRAVLRAPGSEMLNSTYFSLEPEKARDGGVSRLVVRGNGYGHGIGMCQWGAIGRARAGQTARAILATYYPGTTVGPAN